MEPPVIDMGILRGVATVFALLAFVAVVLWAYGKRPRDAFRSAAQLPLEEDDESEKRP
jgi:cytochrome c oxidase cbb3-type subunit 4